MVRLIQKSGFIKADKAIGYMTYIATREGVEKLSGNGAVTENQQKLITNLLRDFPDTEELFEYKDYLAAPTFKNASVFISTALDSNAHAIGQSDVYMKYIATRPRVDRQGEHGLFGSASNVSLKDAMNEMQSNDGTVWTFIYSLHREDAARLGYDNAAAWRQLILSHQAELAEAMKIPMEQFRWCAAFHDEGHHPHIHMMVWSADAKQGFLTKDGIASMRSALTNDIFRDELYSLYEKKDISYKEVTEAARSAMAELVRQMESSACVSPIIEQKMSQLAEELKSVKGKKVYGYLPKPIKAQVDEIVDELAKLPVVAECYKVWNTLRDELEGYYKDTLREHLPLSKQKEFRAIKNAVIQEALRMTDSISPNEIKNTAASEHIAETAKQFCEEKRGQPQTAVENPPLSLAAVTRLLYHMSRIFRENSVPPSNPMGIRADSKRRKKLLQKRLALGHKIDDHEEQSSWQKL